MDSQQTTPGKSAGKSKKKAQPQSQPSSARSTPSKPPTPSSLHRAFEQPTVYASGAHDPPAPPGLPSFVTHPDASDKYYRVVGVRAGCSSSTPSNTPSTTTSAIPITHSTPTKPKQALFGTSCPSQITANPGQRLLGALKSSQASSQQQQQQQQANTRQSPPAASSDDLTRAVKRMLNIE